MTHYLSRSLPFVCSPFFLHVFLPHDFSLLWHITGIPFYVLSLCERVLATDACEKGELGQDEATHEQLMYRDQNTEHP